MALTKKSSEKLRQLEDPIKEVKSEQVGKGRRLTNEADRKTDEQTDRQACRQTDKKRRTDRKTDSVGSSKRREKYLKKHFRNRLHIN